MTCQVSVDGYFSLGARLVIDICGTPDIAFYYDAGMGCTHAPTQSAPPQVCVPSSSLLTRAASVPLLGADTLGGQFGLPYSDKIPIPGVSVDIPLVGSVGAVAEISASGTLSDISIAFGIGACLGEVCDGQLDVIGRCAASAPVHSAEASMWRRAPTGARARARRVPTRKPSAARTRVQVLAGEP